MDCHVLELVLQARKIDYALTDRGLNIVDGCGASRLRRGVPPPPGQSLFDLAPELADYAADLNKLLLGQALRVQLPSIRRDWDGRPAYLALSALPYHDAEGHITGLLLVAQDVTEAETAPTEAVPPAPGGPTLAHIHAEMRHLENLRTTFVATAAHEMRTPLGAIAGYLEVLLDEDQGPLTDGQRECVDIAYASARRLITISQNLLDMTRIEMGRLELHLRAAEMAAVVEQIAAEFTPELESRGQRLAVHIAPDLPPALMDEARVGQIISNLLSNAIKYSPQGASITLSLRPAETEGFIRLSVEDEGMGIAADDQAHVFTRFFRAPAVRHARITGTGLGLSITRSLVELHGGHIWFESEVGRGTTFHVMLPVATEAAVPTVRASARSRAQARGLRMVTAVDATACTGT